MCAQLGLVVLVALLAGPQWWECCDFWWWGFFFVFVLHKPTELAHSFFLYSVLVSVSVFMALSTVFHSINSPDKSPLSHSSPPVLFLLYWSFQLYIFMKVSFSPDLRQVVGLA